MKLRINPVKIALHELPPTGKTFLYSRESGELNQTFNDLLEPQAPYHVEAHIHPLGNAFELTGDIKTYLKIPCALCGIDLPFQIHERLKEILVITDSLPRDGHTAKVNHVTELEEGPSAQVLESDIFDLGEFLHEIVALAAPIRLTKSADCDAGSCPEIQKLLAAGALNLDQQTGAPASYKPFEMLQRIKLKS